MVAVRRAGIADGDFDWTSTSMAENRLEALRTMVAERPDDSFLRYGLAIEYRNAGDNETALSQFRRLITANPDYVAAYYQGGQTLERMGRNDDARERYRAGIVAAERKGDRKTRDEMQAALDLLG